jgi:hypothetical protein
MEHLWLMNHGSIACGIIYDTESMEIKLYIFLIFFYLICMDVYHLGEYFSVCRELDRAESSQLVILANQVEPSWLVIQTNLRKQDYCCFSTSKPICSYICACIAHMKG